MLDASPSQPPSDDANGEIINVSVWRTAPDGAGKFDVFDVPREENQTVLDVVAWIQQNADPTLTYRYACRVGVCGSCAMMVNGEPRWTCRTHVSRVVRNGKLEVGPLRNLPTIRDLAADLDPFFDKWVAAEGYFHGTRSRDDEIALISSASNQRQTVDVGIECINCAVCYAACDTVTANDDYLGPAALNRAWTLYNDAKDGGREQILEAVSGRGGCHNCHGLGSCTAYCPNELNPMAGIAGLKRESAKWAFQRFIHGVWSKPASQRSLTGDGKRGGGDNA